MVPSLLSALPALQGLIVFKVDNDTWTLDLRPDSDPSLAKGEKTDGDKPDITLQMNDATFAQLVGGKLNPQTVSAVWVGCGSEGSMMQPAN